MLTYPLPVVAANLLLVQLAGDSAGNTDLVPKEVEACIWTLGLVLRLSPWNFLKAEGIPGGHLKNFKGKHARLRHLGQEITNRTSGTQTENPRKD